MIPYPFIVVIEMNVSKKMSTVDVFLTLQKYKNKVSGKALLKKNYEYDALITCKRADPIRVKHQLLKGDCPIDR